MTNFLYQFVEGQTHFDMPRGNITKLAPNEPIENVLRSNLHTDDTKKLTKLEKCWKVSN